MYTPDYWCVIKVNGPDPHYRVFGSWSGSYLYGSSWRMNSGITKVEYDGTNYKFYGSSGSVYICHQEMYGCHFESIPDLDRFLNYKSEKVSYEELPDDTDWLTMNWIIK